MADRRRIALLVAVAAFVLGSIASVPVVGKAADRVTSVMGIVESVQGTVITVDNKTYDIKGIPIRKTPGVTSTEISSLKGQTVNILFRNRKIESVRVFQTLPQ